MDQMFHPYFRYADFGGRSTRTEFWLFTLFVTVVSMGLFLAIGGIDMFTVDGLESLEGRIEYGLPFMLLILFGVVSFIPSLAVAVRRFHDAGFSGWIYVGLAILSLIPFLGFVANLAILVITLLPSVATNKWGLNPHDGWERDRNYGYDRPEPAARPDRDRMR